MQPIRLNRQTRGRPSDDDPLAPTRANHAPPLRLLPPAAAEEDAGETDDRLIAGMIHRDQAALGELYDRHGPCVYALIVRMVGDREAAEELLQDVFLSAWRQADAFDAQLGAVRPWLLGIAHHLALNELRRRRRRPQSATDDHDGDSFAGCVDPGIEPPEAAWRGVRDAALTRTLDQLPAGQRIIVELYAAGYSQSEIAAKLGEPLGTVKSRLRRAFCHLRRALLGCGVDAGWTID